MAIGEVSELGVFSSLYADFICETSYDKLPPQVLAQAKRRILDVVGVALAGYALMEFPRLVVGYVASMGGTPEATIIQTKKKFPAINATLANGLCAHAIDMDDGHRFAALHPGTVVVPAALAAAEVSGASSKRLIAGIVVGYEVMIRIGMAINPSSLQRGFHTTGVVGPFGAAAATASIMRLGHEQAIAALGLAGLQGAGLTQVNHELEGAKAKPINPGKAAMSGLLSSALAQKGAQGPIDIFEGEDGFLKAVADDVKDELLTRDLGNQFEIGKVYEKVHAACRHTHPSIDAGLQAIRSGNIDPREIRRISIETYSVAIRLSGIPHPTTPSAARFSIPFSVALALMKKDASVDKYSDQNVKDEDIQSLSGKVQLSVSSKWENLYPGRRGATVTIVDARNEAWSAEMELAKGEPETPLSWQEIYDKFSTNATFVLSDRDAQILGDSIMNLENLPLEDLTRLI